MIPNLSTIHKLTIQFKFFGFQWLKKTLNCLSLFDENYSPCCKKQRMANDSSNFTSSPHNDNKKLDFFCMCVHVSNMMYSSIEKSIYTYKEALWRKSKKKNQLQYLKSHSNPNIGIIRKAVGGFSWGVWSIYPKKLWFSYVPKSL